MMVNTPNFNGIAHNYNGDDSNVQRMFYQLIIPELIFDINQ